MEAGTWVERAERTVRAEAEPAAALGIHHIRGVFELVSGHDQESLAAFRVAERLACRRAAPHYLLTRTRVLQLHALVRLGETERAELALAGLGEQDQERGETCVAVAALPRPMVDALVDESAAVSAGRPGQGLAAVGGQAG